MVQRKRIAFIFSVNSDWMGGTNYILNIISSFNSLAPERQPEVILLCGSEKDFAYAREYTGYPHLRKETPKYSSKNVYLAKCAFNYFLRAAHIPWRIPLMSYKGDADILYPAFHMADLNRYNPRLFWIPDFQEIHLPHFFTQQEIKSRRRNNLDMLRCGEHIVVSSNDAKKDLTDNYPADPRQIHVFRFATKEIQPLPWETISGITDKYNVRAGAYFFCANQIWEHKNHLVLFEAVRQLRDKGVDIQVLCSGKKTDYRNSEYGAKVDRFLSEHNLGANIHLLGLIDRKDQLALMQGAAAILQPSLFEGWSTSIEEAKAMNKFLILSDLPLHKEQVTANGWFFDRHDPADLAEKLSRFILEKPPVKPIDYRKNIRQAAEDFLNIVETASRHKKH